MSIDDDIGTEELTKSFVHHAIGRDNVKWLCASSLYDLEQFSSTNMNHDVNYVFINGGSEDFNLGEVRSVLETSKLLNPDAK